MEEILFKGKRIDNHKWVYGSYDTQNNSHFITYKLNSMDYYDAKIFPKTICQFTGLIDKNNVKIFSDDLRRDENGLIFRIYSVPGGFAIKNGPWISNISDFIQTDILIMQGLTDPQTQSWICNATRAAGNIHDDKE